MGSAMSHRSFDRLRPTAIALCAVTLGLASTAVSAVHAAEPKTLRVVLQADVKILDPIWTTATVTSIHAMMVYDTLFGVDENLAPKPQMVDTFTVSDDRLIYTFRLREGLVWSDGAPVTAADCVASLKRWAAKDSAGQIMNASVSGFEAIDERTFRIALSKPFEPIVELLAKTGPNIPFMMPKRIADTDANQQVTEVIGSGPFLFMKDEWVPGTRLVYTKNPRHVPRAEPASGIAGGKRVLTERVEFVNISDPQTAFSALTAGEVDFLETPAPDYLKLLKANPLVGVATRGQVGSQGMLRLNHLHPPFDDVRMRRAMLALVDQAEVMQALGLDEFAKPCQAVFGCGSPLEMESSPSPAKGIAAAKQLIQEVGYKGEPIVMLHPTDNPALDASTLVVAEQMRRAGLNVSVQSMDWGTLTTRRANKGKPGEGGWNAFLSSLSGPPITNPLTHPSVTTSCDKAWFGWPCDARIEELRAQWPQETSSEKRREVARLIQDRVYEQGVYVPFGQWTVPFAYRKDRLKGVLQVPNIVVFWNIEKMEDR